MVILSESQAEGKPTTLSVQSITLSLPAPAAAAIKALLASQSTSDWLREALAYIDGGHDPVDVCSDIELLCAIAQAHCDEVLKGIS